MKKAMTWIVNGRGDDSSENRLLSYLRKTLHVKVDKLRKIRHDVYKVHTGKEIFILKGFPTLHHLRLQQDFTTSLQKEGFQQTYQFYATLHDEPLFFNERYYGCIQYIEHADQPFYYDTKGQCREGLELLESYHHATTKMVDRYRSLLPAFSLKKKWLERASMFIDHRQTLALFLPQAVISELESWASIALNGLSEEWHSFSREKEVILHGDTVHHNFLRGANGELYLLDFDLISLGPAVCDYLQYANRILPFFHWQLDFLFNYQHYRSLMRKKFFLYALIFPTDIFREWNRVFRRKKKILPEEIRSCLKLTMEQMELRRAFVSNLCRCLK